MQPGRELDVLIATTVMGLERDPKPITPVWLYLGEDGFHHECPPYSTDIAAAWEVVDHIRKTSHLDCFALYSPTDESKHWFARFDKKWHGHGQGTDVYDGTEGDTAPHAICLAALVVKKIAGSLRSV